MSRRDEIASAALQGILAGRFFVMPYSMKYLEENKYIEEWVAIAYKMADAAIAEADKK